MASYLNRKFTESLKAEYKKRDKERKRIIGGSNIILNNSKKIIFALHRDDMKKAEQSFEETEKMFDKMEEEFGFKRIAEEPSFKAAAEEYVEAKLFHNVLTGKKIDKIKGRKLILDSYVGGLSDLTGELVRRAVNKAAQGETREVERAKEIINIIAEELVEFDLTGYLRTKYDQVKTNLKKIEHINYEIKTK